jgi:hypothetical protein
MTPNKAFIPRGPETHGIAGALRGFAMDRAILHEAFDTCSSHLSYETAEFVALPVVTAL